MKISELFRRLSFGELSNLTLSGEGSGTIVDARHPQLIQYINEGLLRLFSRFALRENSVIIEQVDHITSYHLKRQYTESAQVDTLLVPYPYIKDMVGDPFEEDVIRILEVQDSAGNKRPLNDVGNINSVFTPAPTTLQVPYPVTGQALEILYQARHPIIRDAPLVEEENILDQVIELPFFLEGALQGFIAAQVYGHMNSVEASNKSIEYLKKVELICQEVEQKDLAGQSFLNTHFKFEDRGFV